LAAPPPVGEYAAIVSDAWLQERAEDEKRLAERAEAVTAFLAEKSISSDVASEYAEAAWADEAIGRRARYADLTVLGPETLASESLSRKVVEGALFASGRPLLIVPEASTATLSPKRVVVAWDARVEASRAVREALDILAAAEDVRLVLVDPREDQSGHGPEPGADLAFYLARHGVKASVERLPSQGKSVAQIIRRYAADVDAQMLVMGAYGHSRLRDLIFGGVTKAILSDPSMPTFLAR
jgi:nucleotide-binding universal stress UspA family protein